MTVNDLLDGHAWLDIECLERIYLNGYVPNFQVSGQVVTFLTRHLGNPVPSPAIFDQIGQRFRRAVASFAQANDIAMVRFGKNDRKIDVTGPYLQAAAEAGGSRLAAIGVAQEFAPVWTGYQREHVIPVPQFTFAKAPAARDLLLLLRPRRTVRRRVREDLFLFLLSGQGVGQRPRIRHAAGHQGRHRVHRTANGFATCTDPAALQNICDALGPRQIQAFCNRWLARLPVPLSGEQEVAGYWWKFSMRQIEVSRTIVFDAPRHARSFFEALVADNLDMGRPDQIEVIGASSPAGGSSCCWTTAATPTRYAI